jgi:hypothetical protein
MMGCSAGFHPHQARGQLRKERQNPRSPQSLTDNWLSGAVNCMNLENALGQIEADCDNLHLEWLPFARDCLTAITPWHFDA